MPLLAANLRTVFHDGGDLAAHEAMLLRSNLAGVAFANAPLAGVHDLAHPLGGHFHVPHGLSNVLMLQHVLRNNVHAALSLYAEFGPIFSLALYPLGRQAQAQAQTLIEALVALAAGIALPDCFGAVGIDPSNLDLLADGAMLQTRLLANNPREITRAAAGRLCEAAS